MKLSKSNNERWAKFSRWHAIFAWLPHTLTDGSILWLCRIERKRVLYDNDYGGWWIYRAVKVAE